MTTRPFPIAPRPGRPFRILVALAALLMSALASLPAAAQALGFDDVLPVDEALKVSARALARDRIEIRWDIADGYYLYRHRTSAQVEGGFKSNPLRLPSGQAYTDEFFGDVETYRGRLTGLLTGAAADDAETVELVVRYQGCADVGICYPPQTRRLRITLPPAPAATRDRKSVV